MVEEMIRALSRQELREFRYFVAMGDNDTGDRADLGLLELMRNGDNAGFKNVNAIHQTRKRLKRHLGQFALLENLRHDEFSRIQAMMEVARYLFRKNLTVQAWEYLAKAEQMAAKSGEYRLLDYNYDLQLSYSYNIATQPPAGFSVPDLLKKWQDNRALAAMESNANAAYALLINELRAQFSKQLSFDIDELTRNILRQYGLDENVYDNKLKIYCKIVQLVCRALREKREYESLKKYAISSYLLIEKKRALEKIAPEFLIDLLDFICVAALRSKDYTNCEKYTRLYEIHAKGMLAQPGEYSYYDFIPAVGVSDLCLCTGRLEEAKASLLAAQKKYADYTLSARIYFLLRINLLAVHFSAAAYDTCIRIYNEIKKLNEKKVLTEPGFRLELILFTDIYGVIFHYEEGDVDYALYLLDKLKRKYAVLLKRADSKREKLFVHILGKMLNEPHYTKGEKFPAEATQFIRMKEFIAGDFEYISMNAWLDSRMSGETYYQCFLKLVR